MRDEFPIFTKEFFIDPDKPLIKGIKEILNNFEEYRKVYNEHQSKRSEVKGDNQEWDDLPRFIHSLLPNELVNIVENEDININFSPKGAKLQSNLYHVPWFGLHDDNKFKKFTEGFFPVYLFKGDSGVYLTLCLGTGSYSSSNYLPKKLWPSVQIKKNIFQNIFFKIYKNERNLGFNIYDFFDQIDLSRDSYDNKGHQNNYLKKSKEYEIATIFAKYYDKEEFFGRNPISEEKFRKDFLKMVKIYEFSIKHRIYEKVENILYADQDLYSIDTNKYDFIERKYDRCNELYYGVPGCGKSRHIRDYVLKDAKEPFIERVLFHPDYTYSDFIGQILPQVSGGEVRYEFVPGPFTSILKKAYSDPDNKYYLVIEEINRGNAPAIFGDIFQLLDRKIKDENSIGENQQSKTFPIGTSEYGINNPNIASIVYGKENKNHMVRIPSNLSIIASMNTSDQNVFTLDTAFQRRWGMELVPNSFDEVDSAFKDIEMFGSNISWETFCTRINDIILDENSLNLSSEDKRLGVYFVNEKELNDRAKFSEKVLKYLWDDAFKFNRESVFKKEYKSLEDVITDFKDANKNCFDVFNDGIFGTTINYESN